MRPPYTCLYREIWDDPKFYEMSEIGRLVYFYILTTPLGNGLGCFKAGVAAMAEEMRLTTKRFTEGFAEGLQQQLFEYDDRFRVLLIPKYFYRNPPANPNGIKALSKEFVKIPTCRLKTKCYHIIRTWIAHQKESFAEPFEELFKEPLEEPLAEPICARAQARSPSPSPSLSPSVSTLVDIDQQKKMAYSDDFLAFWAAYPRKVGKGQAFKAWTRAKRNGMPKLAVILEAIKKQKKSKAWTKEGGEFIPHPTTWINGGRWDDSTEIEAEEEEFYDPLPYFDEVES